MLVYVLHVSFLNHNIKYKHLIINNKALNAGKCCILTNLDSPALIKFDCHIASKV